jgi:23S rRNA (uracil-5-)-methyltransferase RumA
MICPHFGICGGCSAQDISYEEQVKRKQIFLKGMHGVDIEVVPSPTQRFYRNRMDYVFGGNSLGFRKKNAHKEYVDVKYCYLFAPWANEIVEYTRKILGNKAVRYLVLREGKNTKQRLAALVTFPTEKEVVIPFLEDMHKRFALTSTHWLVGEQIFDDSRAESIYHIGEKEIHDTLGTIQLAITPNSFFQPNPLGAENMYALIKENVVGDTLLDLFCGVGSIGLFCADKVKHLVGVELSEESIALAKKNAQKNHIKNTEFFALPSEKFLQQSLDIAKQADTIIVDPPRSGLGEAVTKMMIRAKPKRIIYVSCNPETQRNDMRILKAYYTPILWKGYDMFPHTPHVECVCVMDKLL